jgi:uncharacterized protein (DUF1684 family)
MITKFIYAFIITCISLPHFVAAGPELSLEDWRKAHDESYAAPGGWLDCVGLFWLKEGVNVVGSAPQSLVRLPKTSPSRLAAITLKDRQAFIKFESSENVTLDEASVLTGQLYQLRPAGPGFDGYSTVKIGPTTFMLLGRKYGFGIRVYDPNSEVRKTFKAFSWFAPNSAYIVSAKWHKMDKPYRLRVPDSLGHVADEDAAGFATFKLNGKVNTLYAVQNDDELLFEFKDKTNGHQTYGAGRMLSAKAPKNGQVILDFNRATNPPCAISPYGTCPLPPKENRLSIPISAGEMIPNNK